MRRLIYYCDVKFAIRKYRGNNPTVTEHFAQKLVCKDPDSDIFKKRVLSKHFEDKSNVNKQVKAFDLKNVYIRFVCIREKLGYEDK